MKSRLSIKWANHQWLLTEDSHEDDDATLNKVFSLANQSYYNKILGHMMGTLKNENNKIKYKCI